MKKLLTFLGFFFCSSQAFAYVCSRTTDSSSQDDGPSLSWFERSVTYFEAGPGTEDIPGDMEWEQISEAFDIRWEQAIEENTVDCGSPSDLSFVRGGTSAEGFIGYNYVDPESNQNIIKFVDTGWEHGANVLGLTTTTFIPLSGQLLDSDIEFNTDTEDFRILSTGQVSNDTDVLNTAVHEIGHFIGLGHSPVAGATMNANASPGETQKQDLECDDLLGAKFKYPQNSENGYCNSGTTCGGCAPPGTLSSIPTITISSRDPNLIESCQQGPLNLGLFLFLSLLSNRFLRRKASFDL